MSEEPKIVWLIDRRLKDADGTGGFHIRAKLSNPSVMDYEVRNLILWDVHEGEPLKFEFRDPTMNGGITASSDVEKGEIYLEGSIKFDGCSHNNFVDGGYVHSCSRSEMTRLGRLFETLYDMALELMPDNREFLS